MSAADTYALPQFVRMSQEMGIALASQDADPLIEVMRDVFAQGRTLGATELQPVIDSFLDVGTNAAKFAVAKERQRIAEYLRRNLMSAADYADAILAGKPDAADL